MILSLFCIFPCVVWGHVIVQRSWSYKGHHIGYEEARRKSQQIKITTDSESKSLNTADIPVLLLNGFGVGTFHQHRLMPKLLSAENGSSEHKNLIGEHRVVYGVDYLGQGRSWPMDCKDGNSENERNVIYSIDTWADQVIHFIEEVIIPNHRQSLVKNGVNNSGSVKLHLVGNSVGGLLAVLIALKRPELIESLCLLNATPVWGLNLPGWSGHLPPPPIPRWIGRYLFDRIRERETIEKYLLNAYANPSAFGDELIVQIKNCTEGEGGHAAFASILWSPPASFPEGARDFYSNLSRLQCDVLLLFGKNDPWCSPPFAKRMLLSLMARESNTTQRYIELDNVGHCPNHEAPTAVGNVLRRWINAPSRRYISLLDDKQKVFPEPWGDITAREVNETEAQLTGWEKLLTKIGG